MLFIRPVTKGNKEGRKIKKKKKYLTARARVPLDRNFIDLVTFLESSLNNTAIT